MCERGKAQTSKEILAYLAEHPNSQDTLEGIAEWWLLERQVVQRVGEVKEALDELVAGGLLIERAGADARSRYRVNSAKLGEIASIIKRDAE
jgi:hypothetical protein